MDNKVIEVLDYMCDKIGVAIDWTAENVMPQVTEFMSRYRIYGITTGAIWIAIFLPVAIFAICFLKTIWKNIITENENSRWYQWHIHYSTEGIVFVWTAIMVFLTVIAIVSIISNAFSIAKWIVIPEVQFLDVLNNYLNSMN